MAASGAKILHLRCVEYARRYSVPLHVRSSFSTKPGTWIVDIPAEEQHGSTRSSPASRTTSVRPRSPSSACPTSPARRRRSSRVVADAGINIDMIVQNVSSVDTGRTDISFTLPSTELTHAMGALTKAQDQIGFESLQSDDQIGKVSLVGAGMRTHPGVTAQVLRRRLPTPESTSR